ncbi:hypothetical protein BXZ70DRAFT_70762 [Cristinia sonorae]|uniref:Uncharacterized protein n=1 Tax=Cristinia sonorae TaxID=1940300 RepID=A0A8K0URM4_9AGAR|nr:hypothetical protein BXZ70DRAFT_70762 [Cristinia sonorae]
MFWKHEPGKAEDEDVVGSSSQQPCLDPGAHHRPGGYVSLTIHTVAVDTDPSPKNIAIFRLPFQGTIVDPLSAKEGMDYDASINAWTAVQSVVDSIPRRKGLENTLGRYALQAMKEYRVEIGRTLLDAVPGVHFTFLDPTMGTEQDIVSDATSLVKSFQDRGIPSEQVVISVCRRCQSRYEPLLRHQHRYPQRKLASAQRNALKRQGYTRT